MNYPSAMRRREALTLTAMWGDAEKVRGADTGHTGCDSTDGTVRDSLTHRHRGWDPGCHGLAGGGVTADGDMAPFGGMQCSGIS